MKFTTTKHSIYTPKAELLTLRADTDAELPLISATVERGKGAIYADGELVATVECPGRGKSFVHQVVKHAMRGVLSRRGRHKRRTANRAERKREEANDGK